MEDFIYVNELLDGSVRLYIKNHQIKFLEESN
jgi:hypothetical protein